MHTPSRRSRTAALLIVTAAAGAVLAGCGVAGPQNAERGTEDAGAVSRVEVDSDSGTVEFRAGAAGSARVDRDVRWRGGSKPQVTQQMRDGVLTVTARCDGSDDCDVDLTITVPAAASVRTDLGAGNIRLTGLTGKQDLTTGAGNVEGTGLGAGPVVAHSGAGNVELAFAAAPSLVDAQSAAGNVEVRVPRGPAYDLDAGTNAGNNRADVADTPGADHRIGAHSSAGNVTVSYA